MTPVKVLLVNYMTVCRVGLEVLPFSFCIVKSVLVMELAMTLTQVAAALLCLAEPATSSPSEQQRPKDSYPFRGCGHPGGNAEWQQWAEQTGESTGGLHLVVPRPATLVLALFTSSLLKKKAGVSSFRVLHLLVLKK